MLPTPSYDHLPWNNISNSAICTKGKIIVIVLALFVTVIIVGRFLLLGGGSSACGASKSRLAHNQIP